MSIYGLSLAWTGDCSAPARRRRCQDEVCPVKITTLPKPFTRTEISLDIGSPPLRWLKRPKTWANSPRRARGAWRSGIGFRPRTVTAPQHFRPQNPLHTHFREVGPPLRVDARSSPTVGVHGPLGAAIGEQRPLELAFCTGAIF